MIVAFINQNKLFSHILQKMKIASHELNYNTTTAWMSILLDTFSITLVDLNPMIYITFIPNFFSTYEYDFNLKYNQNWNSASQMCFYDHKFNHFS